MIKEEQLYSFSEKREDREYFFSCPITAPLGELFDVVAQIQQNIIRKMEQMQPQKEAKPSDMSGA
jgi:hypothetical protein